MYADNISRNKHVDSYNFGIHDAIKKIENTHV